MVLLLLPAAAAAAAAFARAGAAGELLQAPAARRGAMQPRRAPGDKTRGRAGSAQGANGAKGAEDAQRAQAAWAAAGEAPLPLFAGAGAVAAADAARLHGSGEHRHVTFDEAVLAEHDQLRGTRGKIDEPDTPFHRGSFDEAAGEEDLAMMGEAAGEAPVRLVFAEGVGRDLERRGVLRYDDVAQADLGDREDHMEDSEDEGEDGAELRSPPGAIDLEALRAKLDEVGSAHPFAQHDQHAAEQEHDHEFAAKRKQHYNEMEVLRQWKAAHAHGEDEDEDEENEADEVGDEGASASASAKVGASAVRRR